MLTLSLSMASYGQIINEFEPNPVGADPMQSTFELKGTANAPFDLWILSLENDGFNGLVDRARNVVGTFDANGLAIVTTPDLENPSFTVILTDNFTGSIGSDLDMANDGGLDTTALGVILDAVGVSDSTEDNPSLYGVLLGGTNILFNNSTEPSLVFRDDTTGDWYQVARVNSGGNNEIIGLFDAAGNTISTESFSFDPTTAPTYGMANASNTALSLNEKFISDFTIYPNPANQDFINISGTNKTNNLRVDVYNVTGKKLISKLLTENVLDISSLKSGIYVLKAIQDNTTLTKKLIVK